MDPTPPRRVPTPGKRVAEASDISHEEPCLAKRALYQSTQRKDRDPHLLTISEVKKLNFSLQDYTQKFFGRVVCLAQPREYKSQDVHYHRRAFILADHTDFVKGFIRNNDDHVLKIGVSYFFSKFRMFRKGELLVHETSTVFE